MGNIRLAFTPLDLTRTRFAFSPLWEAVMSLRAWQNPDRSAIHLPWLRQVPEALRGLGRPCGTSPPHPRVRRWTCCWAGVAPAC